MAVFIVPDQLSWWRREPGGAAWLQRLPSIVAECGARWGLELGAPFSGGAVALVVPARRADGTRAVLKVNFPEPESEHEAAALRAWDGAGAVRLLDEATELRALLLERLVPGTPLWDEPDEARANERAASVLLQLWQPAAPGPPFRPLEELAAHWRRSIPATWERLGRPYERELVDEALRLLAWLEATPPDGGPALLHQDLHGGNLLLDATRGWVAIDPKPLVGERAFDTASLLRDRRASLMEDPRAGARIRRRLDQLGPPLGLDRERMRAWGVVHALAWAEGEVGCDTAIVACARWLAAA